MRITQTMTYRNLLAGAEALRENIETANQQVASGKRLNSLADSPSGSAELVDLRSELAGNDQYRENAGSGGFFVGLAESVLSSAYNVVTTIYSRGSAGASALYDTATRAELANEVRSLRDQLLSLANTDAQGRHIFAGSQVTTVPFSVSGDTVSYQGDLVQNGIDIANGLQVQQNVAGSAAFSKAFSTVEQLLTALEGGDQAAMQAALSQFAGALGDISQARAELGVSLAAIQNAGTEHDSRELAIRERQSKIEDANLAEAVSQLKANETALEATFTARMIVGQRSLFDYLA
jgi:flagellar hook-associated protein 3 FlgL